jgi:hypothetical protein
MIAFEAADGSFANVSQHAADWAFSIRKLRVHEHFFDDDMPYKFKERIVMLMCFILLWYRTLR